MTGHLDMRSSQPENQPQLSEQHSRLGGKPELKALDQFGSVHTGPNLIFKLRDGTCDGLFGMKTG